MGARDSVPAMANDGVGPDTGSTMQETRTVGARSLWDRILPKTILGLAALLFFMSIASAFSGAALFAYYRFELDDTRDRIAQVETAVSDDLETAQQVLEEDTEAAKNEIQALLDELEQFAATGQTVESLLAGIKDSVLFVSTLDENGQPSVGTAFVLFSDSERSFLLTSYTTIRAATVSPGPDIRVRRGGEDVAVELNGWDEARDLALLIAEDAPNLPAVEVADTSSVSTGDRVFAISALGAAGGSIVQGFVADISARAVQHDAPVGAHFQGGPLINTRGELVAITSRRYAPLGFDPRDVFFAVPVGEACDQVVQCPDSLTG